MDVVGGWGCSGGTPWVGTATRGMSLGEPAEDVTLDVHAGKPSPPSSVIRRPDLPHVHVTFNKTGDHL